MHYFTNNVNAYLLVTIWAWFSSHFYFLCFIRRHSWTPCQESLKPSNSAMETCGLLSDTQTTSLPNNRGNCIQLATQTHTQMDIASLTHTRPHNDGKSIRSRSTSITLLTTGKQEWLVCWVCRRPEKLMFSAFLQACAVVLAQPSSAQGCVLCVPQSYP